MPLDPSYLADQVSTSPSGSAVAIATSDTVLLPIMPHSLYVGVAGDVSVLMRDGTTQLFKNVPAGYTLPIRVQRVNLSGTTATNIIGLL